MPKTIDELRQQFEVFAKECMFDITRNADGEYRGPTYVMWAGYRQCAINNGILKEK